VFMTGKSESHISGGRATGTHPCRCYPGAAVPAVLRVRLHRRFAMRGATCNTEKSFDGVRRLWSLTVSWMASGS
jgi:hypothetical protein